MVVNLLTSSRYQVDGSSMFPALVSGQYVLATSMRLASQPLTRGEIVVLKHPLHTHRVYIKRIVGLPDESISMNWGVTYVNDSHLAEPYLIVANPAGAGPYREWWTGPEEYFVMGDNRTDSEDSRSFGPIDKGLIIGKVWFRYWPPRAWGKI